MTETNWLSKHRAVTGDYLYHYQDPVFIPAFPQYNFYWHEWLAYSSRKTEIVRHFLSLVRNRTCDPLLAWLTREPLGYDASKRPNMSHVVP